jgi:uncharacterized membrane protein YhaH (DUF805 family)
MVVEAMLKVAFLSCLFALLATGLSTVPESVRSETPAERARSANKEDSPNPQWQVVASRKKWVGLKNKNLEIIYQKPSAQYIDIYRLLRQREALEELSAFLAPLRLPEKLKITAKQCRYSPFSQSPSIAYYALDNREVVICYEGIYAFSSAGYDIKIRDGFTANDVALGAFVNIALHEVAHAIFHIYRLPVLGREEDAADQMAAFVILNFGKDIARRTIVGYANYVKTWDTPFTRAYLADEHSTPIQRLHNLVCLAYGGQPNTFRTIAEQSGLSKSRLAGCRAEYEQVRHAFEKTVLPHVDDELMAKVLSLGWAAWEGDSRHKTNPFWDRRFLNTSYLVVCALAFGLCLSPPLGHFFRSLLCFKKECFKEKISRRQWWAYMALVVAVVMAGETGFTYLRRFEWPIPVQYLFAGLSLVLFIRFYWVVLFCVQRLNDRARSPWWVAVAIFPYVIVEFARHAYPLGWPLNPWPAWLVWLLIISLFVTLWVVNEIAFLRSRTTDKPSGEREDASGECGTSV